MNGINYDPGLRQAFTQQTHQRLMAESTHARLAKIVTRKNKDRYELKQHTLQVKIKVISQVIQDAASIIVTILKASSNSANA